VQGKAWAREGKKRSGGIFRNDWRSQWAGGGDGMSEKPRKPSDLAGVPSQLLGDIRKMIEETRTAVAATVNAGLTMLYWRIGVRFRQEILKGKRAAYGAESVSTVSKQLELDYGTGFSEKNLRRMIQLAEVFPDEKIVVALIRQLSWTHFLALIPLKEPSSATSTPRSAG
jgi:hypothetical protein